MQVLIAYESDGEVTIREKKDKIWPTSNTNFPTCKLRRLEFAKKRSNNLLPLHPDIWTVTWTCLNSNSYWLVSFSLNYAKEFHICYKRISCSSLKLDFKWIWTTMIFFYVCFVLSGTCEFFLPMVLYCISNKSAGDIK